MFDLFVKQANIAGRHIPAAYHRTSVIRPVVPDHKRAGTARSPIMVLTT